VVTTGLTVRGHFVVGAETTAEALAEVARTAPDLVVWCSPESPEPLVAACLRLTKPPVLVVASHAGNAAIARRCRALFLEKPFELDELAALIAVARVHAPVRRPSSRTRMRAIAAPIASEVREVAPSESVDETRPKVGCVDS
jgi:DNA-binding response OmpR family regulator